MKHANIVSAPDEALPGKFVEAEPVDGQRIFLTESEYTAEELNVFNEEKNKWIVRRSGTMYFLADSDSGEDARGCYCGYFDLVPENAVFEKGKLRGFYLCSGDFTYSGLSRSSFGVDNWGYPGSDPFASVSPGSKVHVFLFSEPGTHEWKDWDLLSRDPERKYTSYIDF